MDIRYLIQHILQSSWQNRKKSDVSILKAQCRDARRCLYMALVFVQDLQKLKGKTLKAIFAGLIAPHRCSENVIILKLAKLLAHQFQCAKTTVFAARIVNGEAVSQGPTP